MIPHYVREIERGSADHMDVVTRACRNWELRSDSIGLRALVQDNGSQLVVAIGRQTGTPLGACSFRYGNDCRIKRINTEAFVVRAGVGTSMVTHLREMFPSAAHWCLSKPDAWSWCESLGMTRVEVYDDHRALYEDAEREG